MKSSPRPPRRFSRWQTTKRTFVLGDLVPKVVQTTEDEESEKLVILPETDKEEANLASNGPSTDAYDFEEEPKSDSLRGSTKPKHVRKLKLDSSRLLEHYGSGLKTLTVQVTRLSPEAEAYEKNKDDDTSSVASSSSARSMRQRRRIDKGGGSDSVTEETSGKRSKDTSSSTGVPSHQTSPPVSLAILTNSDTDVESSNQIVPSVQESDSMSRSKSEANGQEAKKDEEPSNVDTAEPRNVDTSGSSNVDTAEPSNVDSAGPSNVDTAGPSNVGTVGPSNVDSAGPSNVDTAGPSNVDLTQPSNVDSVQPSNVDSAGSTSGPESPGADKENAEDVEVVSHPKVGTSGSRTEESVLGVSSSHSVNISDGNQERGTGTRRTSLRDRSKLTSPADLMKLRQYPEKFLVRAQKPKPELSQERKVRRRSINSSGDSTKTNVSSTDQPADKASNLSKKSRVKGSYLAENSSYQNVHQETQKEGTISPILERLASEIENAEMVRDGSSPSGIHVPTDRHESPSHDTMPQAVPSTSKGRLKHQDTSSNQHKPTNSMPQAVPSTSKGRLKHGDTSSNQHKNVNSKQQLKPSGLKAGSASTQEKNGSSYCTEQRSLRDRSQLVTPQILQERRQYPVSFYPARKRAELLNNKSDSTGTADSKGRDSGKEESSIHTDNHLAKRSMAISEKPYVTSSSKGKSKSLGLQRKGVKGSNEAVLENLPVASASKRDASKTKQGSAPSQPKVSQSGLPTEHTTQVKAQAKQVLSLPRQRTKKAKLSEKFLEEEEEEAPSRSNMTELQPEEHQDPWEIATTSRKVSVPRAGPNKIRQREASAAIDETVLSSRPQGPRKRQLMAQLVSPEKRDHKARKVSRQGNKQEVVLWCEEDQTRRASDVTALDLIFNVAMDVGAELRDSASDRVTEKVVKKVFTGFKQNMKEMISQDLDLKALEKDVREQRQRCKKLASDIEKKRSEVMRLQKEVHSRETGRDSKLRSISQWMTNYSHLTLRCQANSQDSQSSSVLHCQANSQDSQSSSVE